MNYNFWEDPLDLKCIRLDAELERRAKLEKEEIERFSEEVCSKCDSFYDCDCFYDENNIKECMNKFNKETKIFEREFCGNCSYIDCDGKSYMECFKEFKKELENV